MPEMADPGVIDGPRPARETTAKPRVTKTQFNKAVLGAVTKLGQNTTTSTTMAPTVSPTTRVRIGLEQLIAAGNVNVLMDTRPNLKVMAKDLFDWQTPDGAPHRATGAVGKAFGKALQEHYPQAVEMAAFGSMAARLLDPDRLARGIARAGTATTAYAPERYVVAGAAAMNKLFSAYAPARIETLLFGDGGLWEVAHNGRYWDVTFGSPQDNPVARRRRTAAQREADAAINANINDLLNGADITTPHAADIVGQALVEQRMHYSPQAGALMAQLPESVELGDRLATLGTLSRIGEYVNPDTAVLMSAIPWLAPGDRPESPITWLVNSVISAYTDPETGEFDANALPDKPKEWVELYPEIANAGKFPFPNAVWKLHNSALPGTAVTVQLIRNAVELDHNRTFMGNCTGGYRTQMENGSYALFRIDDHAGTYNASMRLTGGRWALGEINSRFNRGNVPPEIRAAFETLIGTLPPAAAR